MPIQANTAPAVQLPVTGIDPTAAAAAPVVPASPTGVQLPEVQLPATTLSEHDRALIAQTQAQFAPSTGPADSIMAETVTGNEQTTSTPSAGEGSTVPTPGEGSAGGAQSGDTAPVVELTASQKLAAKIASKKAQVVKLNDEIERLEGQFRSVDLLDKIKPSSIIVARVGRAETSREVDATVLGVQTLPNGDLRYKVYFGEGFEAETVVIQSSQIVDVKQV